MQLLCGRLQDGLEVCSVNDPDNSISGRFNRRSTRGLVQQGKLSKADSSGDRGHHLCFRKSYCKGVEVFVHSLRLDDIESTLLNDIEEARVFITFGDQLRACHYVLLPSQRCDLLHALIIESNSRLEVLVLLQGFTDELFLLWSLGTRWLHRRVWVILRDSSTTSCSGLQLLVQAHAKEILACDLDHFQICDCLNCCIPRHISQKCSLAEVIAWTKYRNL
mmetsp:Transcript_52383/g.125126  ORF Transcript_52383/g.125126 Transcript_52383/m.125126 type:complete len:220 (+) Transcript_52383:1486-2145(+)